ncbi:MAG TPA: hypothetical protein VJQ47_02875 [Steroidobacteraceae bacterium]|nr:hypothetical protein [Steroidobacteraceae bacterium]
MKIIAAASAALLATALFGCAQHQSTAPAAAAPAPASSVNTFGDKTDAAEQVARARAEAFGNSPSSDAAAPSPPAPGAPGATNPK